MPDADFKGLAVIRPIANGSSKGVTSIITAQAVPWIDLSLRGYHRRSSKGLIDLLWRGF
jgi:hypothetical protein